MRVLLDAKTLFLKQNINFLHITANVSTLLATIILLHIDYICRYTVLLICYTVKLTFDLKNVFSCAPVRAVPSLRRS